MKIIFPAPNRRKMKKAVFRALVKRRGAEAKRNNRNGGRRHA